MEKHWRWASLMGAQASGSRVWVTSPQIVRQQVPLGCELPPYQPAVPLQCAPPPLPHAFSALAPQPGARACLLSHSHSPGCKRTKSPCTPLASCCPSLCATPQPCLGLPERREAQALMDLPLPPFPGPSRGAASALTGQSGASTVGAKGMPLGASHSVLACLA